MIPSNVQVIVSQWFGYFNNTGCTGTPGTNAPGLNVMMQERFVQVPSGKMKICTGIVAFRYDMKDQKSTTKSVHKNLEIPVASVHQEHGHGYLLLLPSSAWSSDPPSSHKQAVSCLLALKIKYIRFLAYSLVYYVTTEWLTSKEQDISDTRLRDHTGGAHHDERKCIEHGRMRGDSQNRSIRPSSLFSFNFDPVETRKEEHSPHYVSSNEVTKTPVHKNNVIRDRT